MMETFGETFSSNGNGTVKKTKTLLLCSKLIGFSNLSIWTSFMLVKSTLLFQTCQEIRFELVGIIPTVKKKSLTNNFLNPWF